MIQKILPPLLFGAISVYGLAMTAGVAILSDIEGRIQTLEPGERREPDTLAHDLDIWSSLPGLGGQAADLAVRLARNTAASGDLAEVHRRVEEKLRRQPASSPDWLLLAQIRLARGEPIASVNQALEYSILTGRHELTVMIDRVGFALTTWPLLTPDLQRQMTGELSLVGGRLNSGQRQALKTWVSMLPSEEREILSRELSLRFGTSRPSWIKAIGLEQKHPA